MQQISPMNTSRRAFIKHTSIAVAGLTIFSEQLFASNVGKKRPLVGMQLYSVRDEMKQDPLGTLQQLSRMGYKHLEHASYNNRKFYGYTAKEFKKILNDLGFTMPSGHTVFHAKHWDKTSNDFTSEWKYTIEDAATLEQKFVISPSMDVRNKSYDDVLQFLDLFNKSGELCKQSGMKFGYHNHAFEFTTKLNNQTLFDIILQNTDPGLVMQQLDTGNMYSVGGRAPEIYKKYPGRFPSLHVKEVMKIDKEGNGEKYESTVLNKGVIGMKKVLTLAKTIGGTEDFIIEQEDYQGQKPLDVMNENLATMKKWGYK